MGKLENHCYPCDKSFTATGMVEHNNRVHSTLLDLKTVQICDSCSSLFPTRPDLLEHIEAKHVHVEIHMSTISLNKKKAKEEEVIKEEKKKAQKKECKKAK
ncbi:hypothetical protein POM88_052486 [Heracleum sosnowskyi]|uniref:C2H2-type domain-containing protein n=1 Tax=Heracleum sosnowskyi TaxID=360622 RepID=A0AAD8GSN9_9APIA|nr:hypothetical protein POM88_052486 [Heracleum sosnowskyi]